MFWLQHNLLGNIIEAFYHGCQIKRLLLLSRSLIKQLGFGSAFISGVIFLVASRRDMFNLAQVI